MTTTYIPPKAMFIFAHPDDIEFVAGGTAALWAKHGSEITYVMVTDGNVGSHEKDMTMDKLIQTRRDEQRAARQPLRRFRRRRRSWMGLRRSR